MNPGGLDPFGLEIFELGGRWEAHTRLMGEPLAKFSTTADKLTHQSGTPRKGGNGGGEVPRSNEWRLKQKVGLIVRYLPHALRRVLGRPQCRETALL